MFSNFSPLAPSPHPPFVSCPCVRNIVDTGWCFQQARGEERRGGGEVSGFMERRSAAFMWRLSHLVSSVHVLQSHRRRRRCFPSLQRRSKSYSACCSAEDFLLMETWVRRRTLFCYVKGVLWAGQRSRGEPGGSWRGTNILITAPAGHP